MRRAVRRAGVRVRQAIGRADVRVRRAVPGAARGVAVAGAGPARAPGRSPRLPDVSRYVATCREWGIWAERP
ncbi:hypothetical protein TBS_23770 [Thermobispora bispora]